VRKERKCKFLLFLGEYSGILLKMWEVNYDIFYTSLPALSQIEQPVSSKH